MTRFKDLQIGTEFEFDHSDLPVSCGEMAHGPWRKLSARRYALRIGKETGRHAHVVGSVNAEVRTDCECGNHHDGYRGNGERIPNHLDPERTRP